MQRSGLVAILLVALVAGPQYAAAGGKGKSLMLGKGKRMGKGDVNVDVQCQNECKDICIPVPNKVCNDVPYETQVCRKVPVQQTKQVCDRVCTQTQVYTEAVTSGKGKGMAVSHIGKGKGRHLLGKGKHLVGSKGAMLMGGLAYGKGKGAVMAAPQVDVKCEDVCKDIPYTTYTTQCETVTRTKKMCDIVYQQQCSQVCKPVCQKITTVTTTTVQSMGKGMPIMSGKGKGKL